MEKELRIIHTCDIHSNFLNMISFASLIKELQKKNSIVLDAGDFNDFSNIDTLGSNGKLGLTLLSNLHYDALTIGNNEGFQNKEVILQMANYNLVNLLSCNLFDFENHLLEGVSPYIIKTVNGIRCIIIGMSPYYDTYNDYYHIYKIHAKNPIEIVKKILREHKNEYDISIALSHLGLKTDILFSQSVHVDVMIEGHAHLVVEPILVNGTIFCEAGYQASHLGYLDLKLNDNNKIIAFNGKLITKNEGNKIDKEIYDLYNRMHQEAIEQLSKKDITVYKNLKCSIEKECNITNLLVDYLYNKYSCDFSIIQSGLTETSILKGTTSKLDLVTCTCNSPLFIVDFDIKGKYIKKAIIRSNTKEKCNDTYRRPGYRGKYLGKLHVSYNTKIIVKENNDVDIYINNKLLEDNKYYHIVTTDYFLRGMGYEEFKPNKNGRYFNENLLEAFTNAITNKKNYKFINNKRYTNKIDAYIFDMDGTLVDFSKLVLDAWNDTFARHNYNKIININDIYSIMGHTSTEIGKMIFPEIDEKESTKRITIACFEECDYIIKHGTSNDIFIKTEQLLIDLSSKYKLFIVSNCMDGYIEAFFKVYGYDKYFIDYRNNKNGHTKVQNIQELIEKYQLNNPYYVGDTIMDYKASRKAKCNFIYAKYGYGKVKCKNKIEKLEDVLSFETKVDK